MAGDWIKFELITMDKPEVCQLADLAAIDPDAVVGKLLRVWGWFDQHTEDGNAPSVSKKLLDRLVGVTGFCEYMIQVGWMIETSVLEECLISLPNFDRHNGKTAKKRLLTAKRVASHKASTEKGNAKGNARGVSDALPKEDVEKSKDQHNTPTPPAADEPIAMTLDWIPDEGLLRAFAVRVGIPVETFTDEAIAPFVCHYQPSGRCETQAAWVSLLVRWFKTDAVRQAASNVKKFPARPTAGSDIDFEDTGWLEAQP